MATHSFSLLSISSPNSNSCNRHSNKILATSFTGRKLYIRPQNLNFSTLITRRCTTVARISYGLSTTNPSESSPSEIQPKTSESTILQSKVRWSARAIKAFALAEMEAKKSLKYAQTGTEALLLGILSGTSLAAKFLRESGVTIFEVRNETVKLLGKSSNLYTSPLHPPLSKQAQMALDWAVNEKLKSGESGELTTTHLALGIWSVKESAGHRVMATLGFDDEDAKELAKFMDKETEWSRK